MRTSDTSEKGLEAYSWQNRHAPVEPFEGSNRSGVPRPRFAKLARARPLTMARHLSHRRQPGVRRLGHRRAPRRGGYPDATSSSVKADEARAVARMAVGSAA